MGGASEPQPSLGRRKTGEQPQTCSQKCAVVEQMAVDQAEVPICTCRQPTIDNTAGKRQLTCPCSPAACGSERVYTSTLASKFPQLRELSIAGELALCDSWGVRSKAFRSKLSAKQANSD